MAFVISDDLILLINKMTDKRICQSLNYLTDLSNQIVFSIFQNYFPDRTLIDPVLIEQNNDDINTYNDETMTIGLSKKLIYSGHCGRILYNDIHESSHHMQNIMRDYLGQCQEPHIHSLYLNLLNINVKCEGDALLVRNYFLSPHNVNYGGFIETGELCYKMQPREYQARALTFQLMNAMISHPLLNIDIKRQIEKTLVEYANDSIERLHAKAYLLHPSFDIQNEIALLFAKINGEQNVQIESSVVGSFLKSQVLYLEESNIQKLKNFLCETESFIKPYAIDKMVQWTNFKNVSDVYKTIQESPSLLSEQESKLVKTLTLSNTTNNDWERNER